jgi:maltose 6'-phosphate phosphatase
VEPELEKKQELIANYILQQDIDIVCFQEVAQTQELPVVTKTIKEDNYLLSLQRILQNYGQHYHIYYEPFKESFGKYDEGLGFLSKHPLTLAEKTQISKTGSYQDWHRRYVLTYQVTIGNTTFYLANTHFGWSDDDERFEDQYDLAIETLPKGELGFLVGDYNITPTSDEYRHVMSYGMIDIFDVEPFRHIPTHIDGKKRIRIDYMMCTKPIQITNQDLVFTDNLVSDHAGLYVEFRVK